MTDHGGPSPCASRTRASRPAGPERQKLPPAPLQVTVPPRHGAAGAPTAQSKSSSPISPKKHTSVKAVLGAADPPFWFPATAASIASSSAMATDPELETFGPNTWLIEELYRRYAEDPNSV